MERNLLAITISTLALVASSYVVNADDMNMSIMAGGNAMMVDTSKDSLMVDSVKAPEDGFIVVHVMTDGKPGKVIGYAPVKKGENKNIDVKLDESTANGDHLALMLHKDTGKMGTYEFGMAGSHEDGPVMENDKPVIEMVTVK